MVVASAKHAVKYGFVRFKLLLGIVYRKLAVACVFVRIVADYCCLGVLGQGERIKIAKQYVGLYVASVIAAVAADYFIRVYSSLYRRSAIQDYCCFHNTEFYHNRYVFAINNL